MIEIATDRRRIEAEPDEGAHERAVACGRRLVAVRIELGRELWRVEATKTYVAHDCVSIEEYGARFAGVSGREARELVDVGRGLNATATPSVAAVVAAMGAAGGAAGGAAAASGSMTPELGAGAQGEPVASPAPDAVPGPGAVPTAGAPAAAVPPAVTVADAILAGAISVERAAVVGRLVGTPGLIRDGEDAVALAMAGSMRQVRTTIRCREEELAQQEAVVPLALAVTERARDGFRRARSIASERAGEMLTEGETFAVVVHTYLDAFDPKRRGEGARRVPDTSEMPGQRYIPAAVRRAVRERAGDACEVPGCPRRTFLEFMHVEAHSVGGSREEENLLLGCGGHHVLFDAGRIRLLAWEDGHPVFCNARGRRLEDRTARTARTAPAEPSVHAELGDSWGRGGADDGQVGAGRVAERPPPYGEAPAHGPDPSRVRPWRPPRGGARMHRRCGRCRNPRRRGPVVVACRTGIRRFVSRSRRRAMARERGPPG